MRVSLLETVSQNHVRKHSNKLLQQPPCIQSISSHCTHGTLRTTWHALLALVYLTRSNSPTAITAC